MVQSIGEGRGIQRVRASANRRSTGHLIRPRIGIVAGDGDAVPVVRVDDLRLDDSAVHEQFHIGEPRPFIGGREGDRLRTSQRAFCQQRAGDVVRLRIVRRLQADFTAEDAVFPLARGQRAATVVVPVRVTGGVDIPMAAFRGDRQVDDVFRRERDGESPSL